MDPNKTKQPSSTNLQLEISSQLLKGPSHCSVQNLKPLKIHAQKRRNSEEEEEEEEEEVFKISKRHHFCLDPPRPQILNPILSRDSSGHHLPAWHRPGGAYLSAVLAVCTVVHTDLI